MKQRIKAEALSFAPEDLEAMIPADVINRIKRNDDSPVFKAYVVAHEGEANATFLGEGSKTFKYAGEAVQKVYERLRYGLPAFYRHEGHDGSGDDSHRTPIGELVGMGLREVDGKLRAIAAFYITPGSHRYKDLKAASIEAFVECFMDQDEVRVKQVGGVTGIALSDVYEPAFEGATILATMQAFAADPEGAKDLTDPAQNDLIPGDDEENDHELLAKPEMPLTLREAYDAAIVNPAEEAHEQEKKDNPNIP